MLKRKIIVKLQMINIFYIGSYYSNNILAISTNDKYKDKHSDS